MTYILDAFRNCFRDRYLRQVDESFAVDGNARAPFHQERTMQLLADHDQLPFEHIQTQSEFHVIYRWQRYTKQQGNSAPVQSSMDEFDAAKRFAQLKNVYLFESNLAHLPQPAAYTHARGGAVAIMSYPLRFSQEEIEVPVRGTCNIVKRILGLG